MDQETKKTRSYVGGTNSHFVKFRARGEDVKALMDAAAEEHVSFADMARRAFTFFARGYSRYKEMIKVVDETATSNEEVLQGYQAAGEELDNGIIASLIKSRRIGV